MKNNTKCPICVGYLTTTGRPNILQHIKNLAKSEALKKHILGIGKTPHADWIKDHVKLEIEEVHTFTLINKTKTFTIKI